MDTFESVLKQLEPCTYFDVARIIDPTNNVVIDEKRFKSIDVSYPDFNMRQVSTFFDLCNSSQKPVLHLIYENSRVFLLMVSLVKLFGKNLLSEFLTDVTNNVFLNGTNFNDPIGLLSEINHLRKKTIEDELTGLYNRRYIDERLPVEIKTCAKRHCPLSVIFSDLDYYKQINDTYGHTAGDHILREFSKVLFQNIRRDKDWVARYGGEEFMIFLHGARSEKAKEIAERIRTAVMKKTFHFREESINLTCSFGVYTIDEFTILPTVDQILDTVDKKLYQAKKSGRNIVVT